MARIQNKTVNPTTQKLVVTPDPGYDYLGTVTVNAMDLEEKTVDSSSNDQIITTSHLGIKKLTVNGINLVDSSVDSSINDQIVSGNFREVTVNGANLTEHTMTPSTVNVTVSNNPGYSKVTVLPVTASMDEDCIPENIVCGEEILGVKGEYYALLPVLQNKEVYPILDSSNIITPDTGYDGLGNVIVKSYMNICKTRIFFDEYNELLDYVDEHWNDGCTIRYYEYNGSVIYEYSMEEFLALGHDPWHPESPIIPSGEGDQYTDNINSQIIFEGWNWSYQDAREYVLRTGNYLDIGPLYNTRDKSTVLRISPDANFTMKIQADGEGEIRIYDGYMNETYTYPVHGSEMITYNVMSGAGDTFDIRISADTVEWYIYDVDALTEKITTYILNGYTTFFNGHWTVTTHVRPEKMNFGIYPYHYNESCYYITVSKATEGHGFVTDPITGEINYGRPDGNFYNRCWNMSNLRFMVVPKYCITEPYNFFKCTNIKAVSNGIGSITWSNSYAGCQLIYRLPYVYFEDTTLFSNNLINIEYSCCNLETLYNYHNFINNRLYKSENIIQCYNLETIFYDSDSSDFIFTGCSADVIYKPSDPDSSLNFYVDHPLKYIKLGRKHVYTINSYTLMQIPAECKIFVPAEYYEQYFTHSWWSYIRDQIYVYM